MLCLNITSFSVSRLLVLFRFRGQESLVLVRVFNSKPKGSECKRSNPNICRLAVVILEKGA